MQIVIQLSNKRLTSTTTSASTWHLLATANEQTTVNRFSKRFSQAPRPITVMSARSYQLVVGNVRFSCHLPWHSDKDFVFPTFQAKWQIVLRDVVSAALGLRLGLCAGPIEGQLFPREAFLEFGLAGAQTAAEADKAQGQQFGRKHCFDFRFFFRLFWSSFLACLTSLPFASSWARLLHELSCDRSLICWLGLMQKLYKTFKSSFTLAACEGSCGWAGEISIAGRWKGKVKINDLECDV